MTDYPMAEVPRVQLLRSMRTEDLEEALAWAEQKIRELPRFSDVDPDTRSAYFVYDTQVNEILKELAGRQPS